MKVKVNAKICKESSMKKVVSLIHKKIMDQRRKSKLKY
jgi:hypothetical protein